MSANMFYSRAGTGPIFGVQNRVANRTIFTPDPHSFNKNALKQPTYTKRRELPPRKITQSKLRSQMTNRIIDQISFRLAQIPMPEVENPHDFNKKALKPPRSSIRHEGRYSHPTNAKKYKTFLERSGLTMPDDKIPKQIFEMLEQMKARGFDKSTVESMRLKLSQGNLDSLTSTEAMIYKDMIKKITTALTTTGVSSSAAPTTATVSPATALPTTATVAPVEPTRPEEAKSVGDIFAELAALSESKAEEKKIDDPESKEESGDEPWYVGFESKDEPGMIIPKDWFADYSTKTAKGNPRTSESATLAAKGNVKNLFEDMYDEYLTETGESPGPGALSNQKFITRLGDSKKTPPMRLSSAKKMLDTGKWQLNLATRVMEPVN